MKINIENHLDKNICFSSCYPYYFEKKDGEWNGYHYINCPTDNIVERCINPEEVKGFEIVIPYIKDKGGLHRLAVPACVGCKLQEAFREDQWFYSNGFTIE